MFADKIKRLKRILRLQKKIFRYVFKKTPAGPGGIIAIASQGDICELADIIDETICMKYEHDLDGYHPIAFRLWDREKYTNHFHYSSHIQRDPETGGISNIIEILETTKFNMDRATLESKRSIDLVKEMIKNK